jgi:hypothetical protein
MEGTFQLADLKIRAVYFAKLKRARRGRDT